MIRTFLLAIVALAFATFLGYNDRVNGVSGFLLAESYGGPSALGAISFASWRKWIK